MLPRLVVLVYILVKFSRLLLTNHTCTLLTEKAQALSSNVTLCTTEQQDSACKRLRPCQRGWGAKQPVKAARLDVHMREEQDRSERKGNRASQRKTHNCSWWGQDEWVWHLQHSQIEGACHASWMVWGWLSLRSLGPATNLSYPVLKTTAGCKTFETLTMPLQVSWKPEVDRDR